MKEWIKVSIILCSFGFFRELRPSEPFVTDFLSGNWRNITSEQVNREVYPVGTYSYLGLLVGVFLITDILRYKPVIIFSAVVGLITWALLLWTTSLAALQVNQVCYGFFMAAEVAYYTYMYAKVSKDKYQKVTGHARSANLTGRFTGSVLGQLLISFGLMDLRELNYITFGSQGVSLIISLLLPSVGISLYFYSDTNLLPTSSTESQIVSTSKPKFSVKRAFQLLWSHFIESYRNLSVIQWSLWWALAMGGFLMVQVYVQFLWQQIDPASRERSLNGAVEAALTLLGAISAFIAGQINSRFFERFNLWILTICSLLEGAFVTISSFTTSVNVAYIMYILFGVLYMFMITMASAMVAKNLADDCFALIFGINTLVALIIQSILTLTVVSDNFVTLDFRGQFTVFGAYFLALGTIFLIASLAQLLLNRKKANKLIFEK